MFDEGAGFVCRASAPESKKMRQEEKKVKSALSSIHIVSLARR